MDAEGLAWDEGMGEGNRKEFQAVKMGPGALKDHLEGEIQGLRSVKTEAQLRAALDPHLCEADRLAIEGGFGQFQLAAWQRIVQDGVWGWLDDDLALFRNWDFELGEIGAPTTIWQGSDDLMVPMAHARWLAEKLQRADLRSLSGVGHISLVAGGYGPILDALIASSA